MSKLKLQGLNYIIRDLNKTLTITKEESFDELRFEILDENSILENGLEIDNLISGLTVISNSYLPEKQEFIKAVKTKLEKLIRKGCCVKIKHMSNTKEYIELIINVEGKDKYHFYGKDVVDSLRIVEQDCKFIINQNRL